MKSCPRCNRTFDDTEKTCPFDNTVLIDKAQESLIGTTLDKRYRILEKIGEGGMGKVFKAEHIILGKPFAIKVLNLELAQREDAIKRFINEAKVTSKIGHQNIIEVTDFGKTPSGSFYFVMEYIRGRTLYEILAEKTTIPLDIAYQILTQCADALYAAHKAGIIHRDLKPENIMILESDDKTHSVKILDFGISKMLDTTGRAEKLTAMGMIVGTPEYMSPEQVSRDTIDHRTDIYALGIVMYQMLTGNLPFSSTNPMNLLMMHKTKSPKPLRSFNPQIPANIESVCLKCLEKSPDKRYQNMKEFINDFNIAIQTSNSNKPITTHLHSPSASEINIQEVPQIDVSPDKIQEVRNQLFADSSNVWFDPYSTPDENKKVKEESQSEEASSVIIDTSTIEKAADIPIQKNYSTANEEIQLAIEPEKPIKKTESPPPKPLLPTKDKHSAAKTPVILNQKNIESILTRKNITIGVAILLAVAFIMALIIYVTATSGIGKIDKSMQFNVPAPINPAPIAAEKEEAVEEKAAPESENSKHKKQTKQKVITSKKDRAQQPRYEPKKAKHLEYYNQANRYFKQKKYDLAAEYYKSAIRTKPDFALAYRGLGASYAMLGKAELSIKQYEKYIELDPNGPDVDKVIQIINEYKNRKHK